MCIKKILYVIQYQLIPSLKHDKSINHLHQSQLAPMHTALKIFNFNNTTSTSYFSRTQPFFPVPFAFLSNSKS